MDYKYISQPADLIELVPKIMECSLWGLDTETTGLDPHQDKIILLQIGTVDIQYVLDMRTLPIEPLRPFLESPDHRKVCANGKFDYKMIKGNYGIDVEQINDIYYTEKLLNVGRMFGGFGYDDLAKKHLGVEIDKETRSTFGTGKVPTGDFSPTQLEYAAIDVKHLIPILREQIKQVKADGLLGTWQLECAALPCFGDLEFAGMYIDKTKWQSLLDFHLAKAKEIEAELNEMASQVVQQDLFGNVYVNWASPDQALKVFQDMKIKVKDRNKATGKYEDIIIPNTNDKTLKKAKGVKIIERMQEYRHFMIRVNTFGYPYLKALHPITGRLHPEVDQLGTETGRPANRSKAGSVNVLNIPREKVFRECFVAGPDEVIETHDYSACELRIWAEVSGDPKLTEAFDQGIDVHCYVASKLFQKEVGKKDPERTPAKALNFGVAFGMGPFTMWENMVGNGATITLEETKRHYKNYCEEFATGISFLRNSGKEALEKGWLANLSGRRRYWFTPDPTDLTKFPMGQDDNLYLGRCGSIEREGGNFRIQSVNADITKYAMVLIRNYKKKHKVRTEFVNQIYDEIVTRTHKDDSPEFAVVKKRLMIEAAQAYLKRIPMEVEGETGPCWTK